MDGTVLIADDDRTIRTVLTQAFTRAGCRVHATASLTMLMRWVEEGKGDLVITDVMMPDGNGIKNLIKIKKLRGDLPVIVMSAQNTIMTAIQATEADAWDYLPKPFDLPDLLSRAAKAMAKRPQSPRPATAKGAASDMVAPVEDLPLVGRTPAMQDLYRLVARVMNSALPVLIIGESGTGKSLIAKALHDFSERTSQPFLVSTAQDFLGDPLHSGGESVLARTRGGSLILDGLGDLDSAAQARFARLVDSVPDGGPRIIAIADDTLMTALASGAFRQDLYYRLSGVTLHVPPLRERIDDIALLADHVLTRAARDGGPLRKLSAQAAETARQFPWPGNVRQLENVLRRLVITGQDSEIGRAELEQALDPHATIPQRGRVAETGTLAESVAQHVRRYFELHGADLPQPGVYQRVMREVEAPLIDIALEYTGGNQARCADLLGINRNTLRKKTNELDIRVTRRRKLM